MHRRGAPIGLAAVAACSVGGVIAIGGTDTLRLVVEPLQRLGDRAHWTMCLMAVAGTSALGMAIRLRLCGLPCGRLAGYSYTLYLVHYPLLLLAFGMLHPWLHGHGIPLSAACAGMASLAVLPVARSIARVAEDRDRFAAILASARAILRPS